jgi:Ca2+-binding EF-hand superfamily protein
MISGIDGNLASLWASSLFTKLDTQNQGYLEKSDFQSAFNSISGSSDSTTDVEDIFEQLDGNSDGKVTEDEMSSALTKIFQQANNQFGGIGGPGGTPPPPPPQGSDDAGFTKDELTSQIEEIGSSDSKRSSLISNIVQHFEAADTNADGKVSFAEAMAYDKPSQTGASASAASDTTAQSSESQSDKNMIAQQIMKLLNAYHVFSNDSASSKNIAQFSVSA